METLRADVRRACAVRDARAFASPVTVPLAGAAALIAGAAVVSAVFVPGAAARVAVCLAGAAVAVALAHRALLGLFAGLALAVIRPYAPGERVRLHSPAVGDVEAVIVRIGPANSTLATGSGLLVVPNQVLLKDVPTGISA
jgi:hypothetical protein